MPQVQIQPALVTLTANGGADGYITVADNTPIFPNATGWLNYSGSSQYCIVTDLVGTTKFGLRFISQTGGANNSYGKSDCSAFLTGATFNQELQVCEVADAYVKDGSAGGIVTKIIAGTNVTISPPSGVGNVTINASGGGGGAPTDATYIVQTANGSLTNEQALGALASGLLKNTTTTGVLSIATPGSDYVASLGVAGGQTIIGGTLTTQSLTMRPNGANTTTGQVIIGTGTAATSMLWDQATASLNIGSSTPNAIIPFYVTKSLASTSQFRWYNSSSSSVASSTIYIQSNGGGLTLGTASSTGTAMGALAGANGSIINADATLVLQSGSTFPLVIASNGATERIGLANDGKFTVINSPYASFTSAASKRAQANGEVMAFAAVPPSQTAAASTALNAYKWDPVTVTFTGSTNITTATGVNFIDLGIPTLTNASSMSVALASTLVVKGAPAAGGSLTINEANAVHVQAGTTRLDGDLKLSQTTAAEAQVLTLTNGPAATAGGNPDIYLTIKVGANTYVVPGWQI